MATDTDIDTIPIQFDSTRGLQCFDDPEHWRTLGKHRYEPRELWYPLANAVTQWENQFHELMLRDRLRMSKFREAIERTMKWLVVNRMERGQKVIRVIDLGTGYGILSYWVVKSFREICRDCGRCDLKLRVYAIEGNPVTAGQAYRRLADEQMAYAGPGYSYPDLKEPVDASVLVCNTASYDFSEYLTQYWDVVESFDGGDVGLKKTADPRINADLIVSEIFGNIVDNEDGVAILANMISRHLAHDGLVIPTKAQTYLVPVVDRWSPDDGRSIHSQIATGQFNSVNEFKRPKDRFNYCYDCIIPEEDHLCEPVVVQEWDFRPTESRSWNITYGWPANEAGQSAMHTFTAGKDGWVIGLKGFFKMELTDARIGPDPTTLSLDDDHVYSDCWKHLYLPIEEPVRVRKGEGIDAAFARKAQHLERNIEYTWKAGAGSKLHRYGTERPFMPERPAHLRDAINRLCSYVEERVGGRLLLPEDDDESASMIHQALDQLIRSPEGSGVVMPDEFFLAWPSVDKPSEFLWFRICPKADRVQFERVESESELPRMGVVYEYLVDNNKLTQKVSLTSSTFTRQNKYDELNVALAHAVNPGRKLNPNFLSVIVIHAREAFTANATQVQSMEVAVYLMQSRLLIELLVRDYQRLGAYLGSAEQARVLAHEVGQVAQLLRVGTPDQALVVWDGATTKDFLDPEINSLAAHSEIFRNGVFCPLGQAFKAAVHYIEIISEAKTAKTPFDDFVDKPLVNVLSDVTQFVKEACLAHWIRRYCGSLTTEESLKEAYAMQSNYLGMVNRPDKFRIVGVSTLDPQMVLMPQRNLTGIIMENGRRVRFNSPGSKLTSWIAKLIAAVLMNTLKHASNVARDEMDKMVPVALIVALKPEVPEITLTIANRWTADAQRFMPKGISSEDGTGLVLKIVTQNLEKSEFRGVKCSFLINDPTDLPPEASKHLILEESDTIMSTSIQFTDVAAAVLLRRGILITND